MFRGAKTDEHERRSSYLQGRAKGGSTVLRHCDEGSVDSRRALKFTPPAVTHRRMCAGFRRGGMRRPARRTSFWLTPSWIEMNGRRSTLGFSLSWAVRGFQFSPGF